MAERGIYYIGGASGAGKTTSGKQLAESSGIVLVEIDDLQRLIMPAVPLLEQRVVATRKIARCVVQELLKAQASCLVDGAWVEPSESARLRSRYGGAFHPVYCGYEGEALELRLASMRTRGVHWLTRESSLSAMTFLQKQVANSKAVKKRCAELGISYIDFTDFDRGFAALKTDFLVWLRGGSQD